MNDERTPTRRRWVGRLAIATLALAGLGLAACQPGNRCADQGDGDNLRVVGLTSDQRLLCFEENDPDEADTLGTVSGFNGDSRLVGMDYRPANGLLYAIGNNGGVYIVDDTTAELTYVTRLSVALSGSSFGVDFNPTVDRLRIISDTGQNLRANVADGSTMTDGTLTYPGPPPMTGTGVTGAAYTNNDTDAGTATTLYDLDSVLDQTVIQAPANAGPLSPTGKLGVDTNATVGFDIYSTVRSGSTVDVRGLASLTVGGKSRFYRVTLFNGKATSQGQFRSADQVVGIAIPLNQL